MGGKEYTFGWDPDAKTLQGGGGRTFIDGQEKRVQGRGESFSAQSCGTNTFRLARGEETTNRL